MIYLSGENEKEKGGEKWKIYLE